MDFALITAAGAADMTFEKVPDLRNNVYLSLTIVRGSWWFDPAFGMRDTRRLKNTEKSARLIAVWVKEALQWLLDIGRASAIEVETRRDTLEDPGRLKAVITVTRANKEQVTFQKFFEVV